MAKITRKPAAKSLAKPKATTAKRPAAKPGKARTKTSVKTVAKPSTKTLTKPWTAAEVYEAFSRFRNANPEPRGELEHLNPYTLLVAVVLSAQATDAGVNKATRALFAVADTPRKMLALGEDTVRDYIKTIGLYRNKAKNEIGRAHV